MTGLDDYPTLSNYKTVHKTFLASNLYKGICHDNQTRNRTLIRWRLFELLSQLGKKECPNFFCPMPAHTISAIWNSFIWESVTMKGVIFSNSEVSKRQWHCYHSFKYHDTHFLQVTRIAYLSCKEWPSILYYLKNLKFTKQIKTPEKVFQPVWFSDGKSCNW